MIKKPDFTFRLKILLLSVCLSFLFCACRPIQLAAPETETLAPISQPFTATLSPTLSPPAPTRTTAVSSTVYLSTAIPEPSGCLEPSSDYTIIEIDGHKLNQRTYDMLLYAQSLYNGQIDIISSITQGSYTDAVGASFGTHKGGGAVDLSVMAPVTFTILYDEIEPLIHALRLAGFAAWFRDFDDLYDGSPVHIHAIAIGDSELSLPAREQLAGPFGYFWGYDGLPREDDIPQRDPHGGPIVCKWMIDQGYPNKTATPNP